MMPKAGKIMMYTSGCPKNQNTCSNISGSPPPDGLKKLVPKKWSVRSMVTAPASTGMTAIKRYAVISHDQQNSGILSSVMPGARMFMMVTTMLIAPMIEEAPIKCTAKTSIGMESPLCKTSGGYMVQPAAGAPPGMASEPISNMKANGRIQKLRLFMRGSAMSGAPTCKGTIQFARPTNEGITAPKIMTSACMVVI